MFFPRSSGSLRPRARFFPSGGGTVRRARLDKPGVYDKIVVFQTCFGQGRCRALRTVYLLRHAAPLLPDEMRRWCLGSRSDPPLSPTGQSAAAALARRLSGLAVSAVGTSPLLRCRQTAELLFPQLPAAVLPGMAELDCGAWDGLPFDVIRAEYPEAYALRGADPSIPPPGGEPLAQAAARGIAAITDFLAETEGDLAIIGHAGINRAILCALAARPFSEAPEIPMDYLSIHLLCQANGALRAEPRQKGSMVL